MGMLLRLHREQAVVKPPIPKKREDKKPENGKVVEVVETTTKNEPEEIKEKPKFTRSQITLMNVSGLKQVAKEYGVVDYENKSGSVLKRELMEIMGL